MTIDQQAVTASSLVRNFGHWQDRALRAPVYIVHRGRPRLALTSIDLLEALAAAQHASPRSGEVEALLDAVRHAAILVDEDDRIVHLNARAREFLRVGSEVAGQPIAGILPEALVEVVAPALLRSAEGAGEAFDIAIGSERQTDVRLSITRLPVGKLVTLEDVSAVRERDTAGATLLAVDRALALHDSIAEVRINLRGFLERPTPSFLRMSGMGAEALSRIRFVSLFDIASRVSVGDALENVIDRRNACLVAAGLLVGGTRVQPVRVALSPISHAMAVTGILAVLVAGSPH